MFAATLYDLTWVHGFYQTYTRRKKKNSIKSSPYNRVPGTHFIEEIPMGIILAISSLSPKQPLSFDHKGGIYHFPCPLSKSRPVLVPPVRPHLSTRGRPLVAVTAIPFCIGVEDRLSTVSGTSLVTSCPPQGSSVRQLGATLPFAKITRCQRKNQNKPRSAQSEESEETSGCTWRNLCRKEGRNLCRNYVFRVLGSPSRKEWPPASCPL